MNRDEINALQAEASKYITSLKEKRSVAEKNNPVKKDKFINSIIELIILTLEYDISNIVEKSLLEWNDSKLIKGIINSLPDSNSFSNNSMSYFLEKKSSYRIMDSGVDIWLHYPICEASLLFNNENLTIITNKLKEYGVSIKLSVVKDGKTIDLRISYKYNKDIDESNELKKAFEDYQKKLAEKIDTALESEETRQKYSIRIKKYIYDLLELILNYEILKLSVLDFDEYQEKYGAEQTFDFENMNSYLNGTRDLTLFDEERNLSYIFTKDNISGKMPFYLFQSPSQIKEIFLKVTKELKEEKGIIVNCVKNKNGEPFLEIEFGRVEYKEETNIIQLKEATRQYYNFKAQQNIKIKEQKQDDFIRIIINCMKEISSNLNSKIEAGRINDFTGYKGILDYYDYNESLDIYAPCINNDDEKGEKDKLKPPTCEYDLEKEEISLVLYYPFSKEKDLDIAITESSIETGALLGLTIKKEKEYLIPTKKMGEIFIKVTIKYNFGTQKEEEKGSSYTLLPGANK